MTAARNATEFAALDTNNDGVFDGQDDGYSPFYPGSQYVDWVGLSTYWFGTTSPYRNNVVAQPGYMEQYCHGLAAGGFGPDFYNVYAVGDDKPFFVAEGGAALHEYMIANTSDTANLGAIAVGPGEVALKQSWWQEYLTNATFLEAHPRLKAVSLFEWEKPEEVTMRDFRISHAPAVLAAFKADFSSAGIMSRYTLGGYADIVTDPSLNPNQTVPVRPVPVPTVSTPVAGSGTAPSSVSPSASNVPKPSGIEIEKSAAAGRGASVAVGAIAAAIAVAFLV
ncbi:hypothetical protein HKX48_006066 [Thoreauomyces humboldtii]|nr:hypothetical protein HKX48_006066 [Thoreauomyces humboldtii]